MDYLTHTLVFMIVAAALGFVWTTLRLVLDEKRRRKVRNADKARYVIVRHQNGGHCVTVDGPIVCTHVEAKRRARRIQSSYPDHDIEAKKIGERSASK